MCGIAGILRLDRPVTENEVLGMTNAMQHRGPDGDGVQLIEQLGIGHRRLSLIDLEGGKQPMSSAEENYWITFNGELYNFLELQQELKGLGMQFKTRSDTEVILRAYEAWGEKCLERFRGMFAFCIVDKQSRKAFLARDHFGIKPLYYTKQNGFIAFASELKALKGIEGFVPEIDPSAIDTYLNFQYIPAPETVFKKVYKIQPAHCLHFTFDGDLSEQRKYWHLPFAPDHKRSKADCAAELEEVLSDSVKAHLVADVPFGAFLSGGLDSSVVVTHMAKHLGQQVKTFSIGFEEQDYSEMHYAEQVAKKWGTEHHTEIVKPDALGILPQLVKHYGEPFGDSSAIPTWYVSQMARKEVTMVLSGDGGDEAFAGYKTYTDFMKFEMRMQSSAFKQKAYDLASKVQPSRFPPRYSMEKWLTYVSSIKAPARQQLWRDEFTNVGKAEFALFKALENEVAGFDIPQKLQYTDRHTYMTGDILTKVDIASMCHSLEVRTPLIDKKVWEFAAQLPWNYNLSKTNGEWQGKMLLKQSLEKHFPKEFIYRKKMGFAIPITKWFTGSHATGEAIREKLTHPNAQINAYFKPEAIEQFIAGKNYTGLWLLLFLEYWLEDFYTPAS